MNEEKPSFLDRGTILAFALILVFWFGWSKFMEAKYPTPPPKAPETTAEATQPATKETAPAVKEAAPAPAAPTAAKPVAASAEEKFLQFSDENLSFMISSKGMGLKDINVKAHKTRDGKPVILGAVTKNYPFGTHFPGGDKPVDFAIEKKDATTFVGRADVGGVQYEKTMKVNSAQFTVDVDVKMSAANPMVFGSATALSDVVLDTPGPSMFNPSYDFQEWFVRHENTKDRTVIMKADGLNIANPNTSIAALSGHYFSLAVVDRSDLLPKFSAMMVPNSPETTGFLNYQPVNAASEFRVRYIGFAGPKSFDLLAKIDDGLKEIIDYGMFAVIAKPILWLLQYLYKVLGNWGWAIVVLTIIVRIIVLPFNVYSYKSMKVMQVIQPEMQRIRDKYKDKPADQKLQMNQEIMDLMKRHKANPVGGCLPMLLQLPVFLALYQVLGQSIELYMQPFGLWIQDLSSKDPFYVLPVLMGITMFIQQKITPTNMDPQQAKILMWMPVIFSVFMLSLPSGLTLYIFVSTLFGIIQQMVFMRDKKSPVQTVKEAKA